MLEGTMLGRAISVVVIVAILWSGLYLLGKAPAPDMGRLLGIGKGAREVTVGVAETAGEAAGAGVAAFEEGREGGRTGG